MVNIMKKLHKFLSKIGKRSKKGANKILHTPHIVPRNKHTLSRKAISHNALKVLYRLHQAGYGAYLVGGSVRDLLLSKTPKDFDVATNALPQDVKKLFRNCRLIGRRFRLAHIHFGREIIEVATFRGHHGAGDTPHGHSSAEGIILRDNVYGSMEDDVLRRDLSINALYYNIADFSIVDYTNGLPDLKHKIVRIIGDPEARFREDPIRMLRAIRFAGKLQFDIDPASAKAIRKQHVLLAHVATARLFDEVLKLFLKGAAAPTYHLLEDFGLLGYLFPQTYDCIEKYKGTEQGEQIKKLIKMTLKNTDDRINEGKRATPAFFLAVLLWPPIIDLQKQYKEEDMPPSQAREQAINKVLSAQLRTFSIQKRFTLVMREIWRLQLQLKRRPIKRINPLLHHPRFRAAYDFMLLRAQSGEQVETEVNWWTKYQAANTQTREKMVQELINQRSRRPRKKNPPKPNSNSPATSTGTSSS